MRFCRCRWLRNIPLALLHLRLGWRRLERSVIIRRLGAVYRLLAPWVRLLWVLGCLAVLACLHGR